MKTSSGRLRSSRIAERIRVMMSLHWSPPRGGAIGESSGRVLCCAGAVSDLPPLSARSQTCDVERFRRAALAKTAHSLFPFFAMRRGCRHLPDGPCSYSKGKTTLSARWTSSRVQCQCQWSVAGGATMLWSRSKSTFSFSTP